MTPAIPTASMPEAARALAEGRCRTPFDVLGIHPRPEGGWIVRVFIPWARSVAVLRGGERIEMERVHEAGIFEAAFPGALRVFPYRLAVEDPEGRVWEKEDPYRFGPTVDETRVHEFLAGRERRVHEVLGATPMEHEGVRGTRFAVWAPHAHAVNLMGDMNGWDGRCHPMRSRGATGVWELFVPEVDVGARYKYEIVTPAGLRTDRADPAGRAAEIRPATASEVWDPRRYVWRDREWMERRAAWRPDAEPVSSYEVHLGSWRRKAPDATGYRPWLSYRELADELLPYVRDLGFTHVELLPVMEHPLDQSWGYQPLGFFAPTSRYGTPDDLRHFVDRAHQLGLGVILDWVPGHFPTDGHGLVHFDGTPLYEDPDPLRAQHPDWGTLVFDFGKPPVRSFLVSSALHWLEDYHVDGLRVDAVASMLYLDYSRPPGTWRPNRFGGRENLDALEFLRELNDAVHQEVPGAFMIAEESTSWPGVSHGTDRGGVGFDQKWNMGWMHDTLEIMSADPVHRSYKYDKLTFPLVYAFSERFVLPLSHDEVVHGKGSLLGKMPGSYEQKFANLRLLYAYMWTHPGKKLLFMGGELAQWAEWNVDGELDWALVDFDAHRGVGLLLRDLNRLYRTEPALHAQDHRPEGFEWLHCHDPESTTLSWMRWSPGWQDVVVVAANFTPVHRFDFQLAVPWPGRWRVVLNTDAPVYGGSGVIVPPELEARPEPLHGRGQRLALPLPGLSVLILKPSG
ncbi:MAG TPA: 1,4-alpha-glucan branching protein GlgB [Longimicrobiales bacterium]|nr:1,4-alpha-glucan branching protein GlgB [Longimicrobiales bacterium]